MPSDSELPAEIAELLAEISTKLDGIAADAMFADSKDVVDAIEKMRGAIIDAIGTQER